MAYLGIILHIIIILLLLKCRHSFALSLSQRLSTKTKLILATFIILAIASAIYGVYTYYVSFVLNKSDHWYKQAQQKVSYHIYQPTFLPEGFIPRTTFPTEKTLAEFTHVTESIYDVPLHMQLQSQQALFVRLLQTQVDDTFTLREFVKNQVKTRTPEVVQISSAKNQEGLLVNFSQTGVSKWNPQVLYMLKEDNVLVVIAAPNISRDDLLQIAESLQ